MKELETDALIAKRSNHAQEEEALDLEVLRNIEKDLEPYEKISLLFLILDNYRCYDEVHRKFSVLNAEDVLCSFVETIGNWQERLYEALCITGAKKQIRKLGKSFDELSRIYLPTVNLPGGKVHWGAKILFKLFDDYLIGDLRNRFLQNIYEEMERPEDLRNEDPLELHAFYWLQEGYITLAPGYGDLRRIKEQMEMLRLSKEPIFLDIENFCSSKYKLPRSIDAPPVKSYLLNGNSCMKKEVLNSEDAKSFIESAYILIINEVNFKITRGHEELEKRDSSILDVKDIEETFEKFDNYVVKVHTDVTWAEIKDIFHGLKDIFATGKYDGLFVWILSHGIKGHFTASDGIDVPFSFIEESICIKELRNRPKVAIVQACQGKKLGIPADDLTSDGPGDHSEVVNIDDRKEFLIFSSTMENFRAIRSKRTGAWFINACCEVIREVENEGRDLSLNDWTKKVKNRVAKCRGELLPGRIVTQLPEVSFDRTLLDFYFPFHLRKKKTNGINTE